MLATLDCLYPTNSYLILLPSMHSATWPGATLMMYSFMGGGLFCAIVGNILLVVSTATDYWMQYRLSGSFAHQGLWRYCMSGKCYMQTDSIGRWKPCLRRHICVPLWLNRTSIQCFYWLVTALISRLFCQCRRKICTAGCVHVFFLQLQDFFFFTSSPTCWWRHILLTFTKTQTHNYFFKEPKRCIVTSEK